MEHLCILILYSRYIFSSLTSVGCKGGWFDSAKLPKAGAQRRLSYEAPRRCFGCRSFRWSLESVQSKYEFRRQRVAKAMPSPSFLRSEPITRRSLVRFFNGRSWLIHENPRRTQVDSGVMIELDVEHGIGRLSDVPRAKLRPRHVPVISWVQDSGKVPTSWRKATSHLM